MERPQQQGTRSCSPLWAITSFYNPAGYRRRVSNFARFRQGLDIPLVTVELSYDGNYQLTPDPKRPDDIIVPLSGHAVLWQKERLLNVALQHVPQDVPYIAWLDGDIVFADPAWPAEALAHLRDYPVVQLFSHLYDLAPDVDPADTARHPDVPSGSGIAYQVSSGNLISGDFLPQSTTDMRRGAFGLAWAARRALLERHAFYDAMILGSGDRAMACAAYGRFDAAIQAIHLNEARKAHYLHWAEAYHQDVAGNVGYVPGSIFHLWHGDLANRGYKERHIALAQMDFDPVRDLRVHENGTWDWAHPRPDIEAFIARYFESRQEDGSS